MKTFKESVAPFKDENGNSLHMAVVATIDYISADYPGAEDGRYVVHDGELVNIKAKQYHTYLDAINECYLRFGPDFRTVCFRPDELLICKVRVQ